IHVPREGGPSDVAARWKSFSRTDVPLRVLQRKHPVGAVLEYVRGIPREDGDFVTVVIPELIPRATLLSAVRRRTSFYLKVRLLSEPQIVISDVPVVGGRSEGVDDRPLLPRTTEALVFVSAVNDATVRAINYARTLRTMDVRAVFFALDSTDIEDIENEWSGWRVPIALDIVGGLFRDLTAPIL